MKHASSRGMLMLVALGFFLLPPGAGLNRANADMKKEAFEINCNIQQQACTQDLFGRMVTLDILPKPVKAMEDLLFRIRLPGTVPSGAPYIDLGMPGMKMGPNRVTLKTVGPDIYEGWGVIVRCPSGRTLWRASVTIPGTGTADFIFNVIY